ncbi:unnamed protein product [Phaedon cochleariae]|uniref:Ubiquinone biosynthesis O-methyltransferase, mitochondrial n=1 Tax=Phaedon cochleariae TaxID=80249 RepID=A0A9P0DKZ5_PHACE|nr:unnamed protein product [Phaedon cochleariae]
MLKGVLKKKWNQRLLATTAKNIDNLEIEQFQKFTSEWWDEFGPLKPLHSMNKLRVPFFRDAIMNTRTDSLERVKRPLPLAGISILDVGCGGGILSEPLARLGSNVTGIDANPEIINLAKKHNEEHFLNITYQTTSVEEHASENADKYDAIVASEIIEHVSNKNEFLEACLRCLKPKGSIFITTINRTRLSKFAGIFMAENILRLVPKGTHQYEKFIEPHKVQLILENGNCRTEVIHGMVYNFITNTWHWSSDTSINYALHAVKLNV